MGCIGRVCCVYEARAADLVQVDGRATDFGARVPEQVMNGMQRRSMLLRDGQAGRGRVAWETNIGGEGTCVHVDVIGETTALEKRQRCRLKLWGCAH
jgi:hypothetical protein